MFNINIGLSTFFREANTMLVSGNYLTRTIFFASLNSPA